jgi:thioredoxin reductase/Pyruvate/2-oxoacid:ferredoxin oxidoreductase delta subunit
MKTDVLAIYALPLIAAFLFYVVSRARRTKKDAATLQESLESGLTEPPSLHPEFDTSVCIGSGACVAACPEQAVGMVHGKAQLVNPSVCIGHGACAAQCPMDAIELVFGTERRGVDIPDVAPNFETNVPNLFIAGELGGMGLVHKAVEQGRNAMQAISQRPRSKHMLDVVIVGAGPAGLSASLAAKEHGLRFATIEQEDALGGTVYHYPRHKLTMTSPMRLPVIGKVKLGEVRKEALLAFWTDIVERAGLEIEFCNRMLSIEPRNSGFHIKTQKRDLDATHILLAIGRRGTPRKLDVPGEDLPKVSYRLIDPEQYRGQHVLVVGGGDSAVEAAVAISEITGTVVSLSYRGKAFNRIKPGNRKRLDTAASESRLRVLLESNVLNITRDKVTLKHDNRKFTIANDAIIVCAGGVLPTEFLRSLGVQISTHFGKTTQVPAARPKPRLKSRSS